MVTAASECRQGLFQDADFAGDLKDSKSTSGGMLYTFVPKNWTCKTQTAVSHTSTEAEKFSLSVGVTWKEILALNLWDMIIDVLESLAAEPVHETYLPNSSFKSGLVVRQDQLGSWNPDQVR